MDVGPGSPVGRRSAAVTRTRSAGARAKSAGATAVAGLQGSPRLAFRRVSAAPASVNPEMVRRVNAAPAAVSPSGGETVWAPPTRAAPTSPTASPQGDRAPPPQGDRARTPRAITTVAGVSPRHSSSTLSGSGSRTDVLARPVSRPALGEDVGALQALVTHLSAHLRSVESMLTRRCDLLQADLDALAARPRDAGAELRELRAECGRLSSRADRADEDRAQLWERLRALRPEGGCAESCAAESQVDVAELDSLLDMRLMALVDKRLAAGAAEREQLATHAEQRQEELAREVAEEREAWEAGQKELFVLVGNSQRQSAGQLRLAEESFRERSEALEKTTSEATAELEKRLEALQVTRAEASESRLQLALEGQEALSSGLASLGRRINERHAQLSGKLEEALGEMAEHGEILSLKLSTETLSLRAEMSDMFTELSGLVCKVRVDHALLQDAVSNNAAETQALELNVKHVGEMLQEQIHSSIQAHDHQQQTQLRLLAEDADERANAIAMELKAEGQKRDHAEAEIRQDILSCSDRYAHLQQDVGDLRAVWRVHFGESVSRRDEADAAAVRDGLVPIGFGGTAIATAAFLL